MCSSRPWPRGALQWGHSGLLCLAARPVGCGAGHARSLGAPLSLPLCQQHVEPWGRQQALATLGHLSGLFLAVWGFGPGAPWPLEYWVCVSKSWWRAASLRVVKLPFHLLRSVGWGSGTRPTPPPPPQRLKWPRPKVTIPQAVLAHREDPPPTVSAGPPLAPLPALEAGALPMTFCLVLGTILSIVALVLGARWCRRQGACRGRWVGLVRLTQAPGTGG